MAQVIDDVKQALGLPSNASQERVQKAIKDLQEQATAKEEAKAEQLETLPDRYSSVVPEGHVRTRNGIEPLVEKSVKCLSLFWHTLEPSPTTRGNFIEVEHRAERGETIKVPKTVAERFAQPDIDAWFKENGTQDVAKEQGVYHFAQMSEADLINWHRATTPDAQDVIDASEGDPEVARRLISAETTATQGEPREVVIQTLGEIIARGTR